MNRISYLKVHSVSQLVFFHMDEYDLLFGGGGGGGGGSESKYKTENSPRTVCILCHRTLI